MNEEKIIFKPVVAIAPGETLLELIRSLNITQAELARRMGRPLKLVNEIIKGKTAITPETAVQLEQVLGKPAAFWNNLESIYQDLKIRHEQGNKFKEMIDEAKKFPYAEMARHEWVPETRDAVKKVENLLQFFSVTSFENIIEKAALQGAYSISTKHKYSMPAIYAWLRQGVREVESVDVKEFDKDTLINNLPLIKALSKSGPDVFAPELDKIFRECGIAFVVVPELTNAPIFGSTRWLAPNKALIQMSIRLKWADYFWFHLFHEIGHILFDNKKEFNVDFKENNPSKESEERASEFAMDALVPKASYEEIKVRVEKLRSQGLSISDEVKKFATKLNIHPGIIIGRLQHERVLPYTFNQLRMKLEWAKKD